MEHESPAAEKRNQLSPFNRAVARYLGLGEPFQERSLWRPGAELAWRLATQKGPLLNVLRNQGRYGLFTREWVAVLAELLGSRMTVEIGAGNGSLSALLRKAGVSITATDDYSWENSITYPASVVRMNGREALAAYEPQAVVCAWPPPRNDFEQDVFSHPSVELYIAVAGRHDFTPLNLATYKDAEERWQWTSRPDLARYILPREIEPVVYQFTRRGRGS